MRTTAQVTATVSLPTAAGLDKAAKVYRLPKSRLIEFVLSGWLEQNGFIVHGPLNVSAPEEEEHHSVPGAGCA